MSTKENIEVKEEFKSCKHCAESILIAAKICKHCGKGQGTSLWVWLILMPFAILMVLMIVGLNVDPNKSNARLSVEECWSSYDDLKKNPQISNGALSTAYGACQQMAKSFEDKYGRSPTLRKN